ncbi:MAG: hypothetical protein LUQ26_15085, partial [Methylococcaceae bacterium]|nr:hypothetical protein [Methylococcaceae bacterium]
MAIWGVDSVEAANSDVRIRGSNPGEKLFDFVQRQLGEPPYFWGRYLNERPERRPSKLMDPECNYIFNQTNAQGGRVRILLVYNDITPDQCAVEGNVGYSLGKIAAQNACRLARELDVPPDVRIYADLEGWIASPSWIRGWWNAMAESEFAGIGGLYGRGVERLNVRGARTLRFQD